MSLRNEHFQNVARGPRKYVGPGPSRQHFENDDFEKRIGGGDPHIGVNLSRGLLVYIGLVHLFTLAWTLTGHL